MKKSLLVSVHSLIQLLTSPFFRRGTEGLASQPLKPPLSPFKKGGSKKTAISGWAPVGQFSRIVLMVLFLSLSALSLTVISAPSAHADHQEKLIMGRSVEAFPETMSALQEEIKKAGYTISIVQRVDIGLTGMGFKTDKYRVVFFGKPEEIKTLPKKYPLLAPYLPLSIAIFAEEQETVLIAMSPLYIDHSYSKAHPELSTVFQRWKNDIQAIIERVCYDK